MIYKTRKDIFRRINQLKDLNLPYAQKVYIKAKKNLSCAVMTRKRCLDDWINFRDMLNVFIESVIRKNEYESELRKLKITLTTMDGDKNDK